MCGGCVGGTYMCVCVHVCVVACMCSYFYPQFHTWWVCCRYLMCVCVCFILGNCVCVCFLVFILSLMCDGCVAGTCMCRCARQIATWFRRCWRECHVKICSPWSTCRTLWDKWVVHQHSNHAPTHVDLKPQLITNTHTHPHTHTHTHTDTHAKFHTNT